MFLSLEYCFTIGQLKSWGITYRQPTVISLFALLNSPVNLQITSMVSYQYRPHTLHVIYTSHSVTSFMKCPGSLKSTKYHLWSGMIGEPFLNFRLFHGQFIHRFLRHEPKFAVIGSHITYYTYSMNCILTILFMIHIINCQQSEVERYFTDWIVNPGTNRIYLK